MSYRDDYRPIQGPKGDQGIQGPPGPQGIRGDIGPQGPTGPQGARGPQGEIGEMGPRGPIGPQGPAGNNGARGPQGPEGPMGPRGFTGRDGTVRFEELTPGQREMIRGPRGDVGPMGPQGPRGEQGIEGPQGDIGPQGATGATGPQGAAGTPGERGAMGPMGPMGPSGPKGDPGSANITEDINHEGAWSGKNVAEFVNNGNINWTRKEVNWDNLDGTHKISDTANGFAKEIIVHGNTVTNYSTLAKPEHDWEISKTGFNTIKTLQKNIYDSSAVVGRTPLSYDAAGYTVIYKIDGFVVDDPTVGSPVNFASKLTVATVLRDSEGEEVRSVTQPVIGNGGYIKHYITWDQNRTVKRITLNPIVEAVPSDENPYEGVKVAINIRGMMILKGDYRGKVPPNYFQDGRGVGIKEKNTDKYLITVETRNKNLIDTSKDSTQLTPSYYLKQTPDIAPAEVRWLQAVEVGSCATYLVYCKPDTDYVFSMKTVNKKSNSNRLFIVGYTHDPQNGEPGEVYSNTIGQSVPNEPIVKFHTGQQVNLLAIYIANFSSSGEASNKWHIEERCREVQLEEGTAKTPYEPFRSSQRTIKIKAPLREHDVLFWSNIKGKYGTKRYQPGQSGSDGHYVYNYEEVEQQTEELIHTYNGTTYVFVRSKIPSKVEAYYPIKAHVDYYTKAETQTTREIAASIALAKQEIENSIKMADREGQENLNGLFITFNGFRMTWRDETIPMGTNTHRVNPAGLENILAVQVQRVIPFGEEEVNGTASVVTVKRVDNSVAFDIIDKAVNADEDNKLKGKARKYNVLIISQARVNQ